MMKSASKPYRSNSIKTIKLTADLYNYKKKLQIKSEITIDYFY